MRAVFLGACVALSVASVVHAKCNGVQKFDDETGKACVQAQANVGPNMRVQQGNLVVSLREGKKVSNGVWLGTQPTRVRELKCVCVCAGVCGQCVCVCTRVVVVWGVRVRAFVVILARIRMEENNREPPRNKNRNRRSVT